MNDDRGTAGRNRGRTTCGCCRDGGADLDPEPPEADDELARRHTGATPAAGGGAERGDHACHQGVCVRTVRREGGRDDAS